MSDDGPFGATASSGAASDDPYQFAGRELDPNGGFGIYYFRARYYDSLELNRFLQRDPQGLSGGNYATLYSYVGNSPLNGIDPTGQFTFGSIGPLSLGWQDVLGQIGAVSALSTGGDGGAILIAQLGAASTAQGNSNAFRTLYGDAWGAAGGAAVGAISNGTAGIDPLTGLVWGAVLSGDYSPQGIAGQLTSGASGAAAVGIFEGSSFLGAGAGLAADGAIGEGIGEAGGLLGGGPVGAIVLGVTGFGIGEGVGYLTGAFGPPTTAP